MLLFLLFFVCSVPSAQSEISTQNFDREAYYNILASGKMDKVNEELELLSSSSTSEKEAYEGTLLMRKAGLEKVPAVKLKYFKKGRIKLETAIQKDSTNAEYHFLRLIIQEHAPAIVKYNAQIQTDKQIVKTAYKNLPHSVQQAIMDYAKKSKVLHPEDLN